MVNYKNGKTKYNYDYLGSLYFDWQNYSSINRPVIYIGGQMEHRFHIVEKLGLTFDTSRSFFDGSWAYEYPIFHCLKSDINSVNFAVSLNACIEKSGLTDVDIVTYSYGGLIGLSLTNYPAIHKVVAIHPPILGTPLANLNFLKSCIHQFNFNQKFIIRLISNMVDDEYGFQSENRDGIYSNNFSNVDLSKYYVIGSGINYDEEMNIIMKKTYEIIYMLTHKENDGVVIYSSFELKSLGVQCITEDVWQNHFDGAKLENIEKAYTMSLKKFR